MANKNCPKCSTENPMAANYCRHCGYEFSEMSKQGKKLKPEIHEFLIMTSSYTVGSTIELMWRVENADKIVLDGNEVTNEDKYEYVVEGNKNLELIAFNEFAQARKTVNIAPSPKPQILRFEASRRKIRLGEEIKVSVDYKYADKVTLQCSKSQNIELPEFGIRIQNKASCFVSSIQTPVKALGLLSKKQYAPRAAMRFMMKLFIERCLE